MSWQQRGPSSGSAGMEHVGQGLRRFGIGRGALGRLGLVFGLVSCLGLGPGRLGRGPELALADPAEVLPAPRMGSVAPGLSGTAVSGTAMSEPAGATGSPGTAGLEAGAAVPAPSEPPSSEPESLHAAQKAWQEGQGPRAVELLRTVLEGDSSEAVKQTARYRLGTLLATLPGRSLEAAQAFEAFVAGTSDATPVRLKAVAENEIRRLRGLQQHVLAWDARLALVQRLEAKPWPEQKALIEQTIAEAHADDARLGLLQLMAEVAWFERDWTVVVDYLERGLLLQQRLAPGSITEEQLALLKQGRRERLRQHLAYASVGLAVLGSLGLLGMRLRPSRRHQAEARGAGRVPGQPLGRLLLQWLVLVLVLYGLYRLGRKPGDVSPVTLLRLGVLLGMTGVAQALGMGWQRVLLEEERGPWRRLRLFPGLILHLVAVYLFCYFFDYVSVLGL